MEKNNWRNPEHFYVFKCENCYKLGITNYVNGRLDDINRHNPFPVTEEYSLNTKFNHFVETYWHAFFAEKRIKYEWFKLSKDDVELIKNNSPIIATRKFLETDYDVMYKKYLSCGYYQGKNIPSINKLQWIKD